MSRKGDPDPVDLEGELDRLYQLPLTEFVPARNELVKRLRRAARQEEAAQTRVLAKPSLSAWAINRLHAEAPAALADLFAAGKSLRRALETAGPKELQAAMAERRAAIGLLAERAKAALGSSGHATSAATMTRISSTLEAISILGEGGCSPPLGRLDRDLEPPGIEALSLVAPATPKASPPRRTRASAKKMSPLPAPAVDAEELAEAGRALAEARQRRGEAAARVKRAVQKVRRLEAVADLARRALADAEERRREADAALSQAEDEAEAARKELRQADEAVDTAAGAGGS